MIPLSLWETVLVQLGQEVSEKDLHASLRTLSADAVNGALVLRAPNPYVRNAVESRWLERITELASAYYGDRISVKVELESTGAPLARSGNGKSRALPASNSSKNKGGTLKFGFSPLSPIFTFDQHIVGDSNRLARCAAEAASKDPGRREYNPLFLYGTVGIGKTHLMQAVGHALQDRYPNAKVGYVNAQNFVQHIINAILNRNNEAAERMKNAYRELDALLIDDIHLFSGKESSQAEFLQTFNLLLEGGKQVIITSDKFSRELVQVEDRIKSRLSQGLTVRISPPELETRIAILEIKAKLRDIHIKPEVLRFLAENITTSVRELEGALNKLAASHRFMGKEITIAFVRNQLEDLLEFSNRTITIDDIQAAVARYYDVRLKDILSAKRRADLVLARQVAMSLCREFTSKSLPEIGKAFGGKNHATVLYALKKVREREQQDKQFRDEYKNLHEQFVQ